MKQVVRGYFEQDSWEPHGPLTCDFVTLSGDRQLVDYSKHPDVPPFQTLEVTIVDGVLQSWGTDSTSAKSVSRLDKDIAVVGIVNEGTEITDRRRESVAKAAKELQDEYRRLMQASNSGWTSVNCTPYVIDTDEHISYYTINWSRLRERVNQIDNKNHYYIHGLGGTEPGACGRAVISGYWGISYCGGIDTIVHEQGHMMGCGHASTPTAEYGERSSWMGGGGNSRDNMNAPHIDEMGLMEEVYKEEVLPTEAKEYLLAQSDLPPIAMKANEKKMVLAKTTDMINVKQVSVSYHDGEVHVHIPSNPRSSNFRKTTIVARLEPGEEYTVESSELEHGVRVVYVEEYKGSSRVQVYNNTTTTSPTTAGPFPEWQEPTENYPISQEIEGIWDHEDWTVQGLHINYLEDRNQLVVYWLTWDLDYNPEWYTFVGIVDENHLVKGDIYTAKKNVTTSREVEVYYCGEALMYMYDKDNGMLKVDCTEFHNKRFAFPFTRVSTGIDDPLNGYWDLPDLEREGLSVNVNRTTVLAYWFRYQDVGPADYDKNQDWLMVSGRTRDDLTIYRVTGGYRGVHADFEVEEVGTASLTTEAFTVTMDGETNVYNLRRIA